MAPRPRSPIYVTFAQLLQLEGLLGSRTQAAKLLTRDVSMATSQDGFVFVVEKPGLWSRGKLLELRQEVTEARLHLTGLQPTNHSRGGQFHTQFPGCYVVAVNPRPGRFNFIPFT